MSVCVYVFVYIYTCIYICTYIYIYAYIIFANWSVQSQLHRHTQENIHQNAKSSHI